MRIEPYLQFNGNCAQALEYYRQHLQGENLCLMPFRGSPGQDQVQQDWYDKIMHGSLQLGATTLMGSDGGCREDGAKEMSGCSVCLSVDQPDQAERAFAALAHDGNIHMPLQETFWAHRFGMLKDQFGVAWMINCLKTPDSAA
ncbi:VOC family protein [Janthinobacterium sp. Mn2066]|uniref:VOC family protein n=1 Tax=Janthinobacterium sp. Mn2066 TaxID=3395264 RepID=UPI003BCE466E